MEMGSAIASSDQDAALVAAARDGAVHGMSGFPGTLSGLADFGKAAAAAAAAPHDASAAFQSFARGVDFQALLDQRRAALMTAHAHALRALHAATAGSTEAGQAAAADSVAAPSRALAASRAREPEANPAERTGEDAKDPETRPLPSDAASAWRFVAEETSKKDAAEAKFKRAAAEAAAAAAAAATSDVAAATRDALASLRAAHANLFVGPGSSFEHLLALQAFQNVSQTPSTPSTHWVNQMFTAQSAQMQNAQALQNLRALQSLREGSVQACFSGPGVFGGSRPGFADAGGFAGGLDGFAGGFEGFRGFPNHSLGFDSGEARGLQALRVFASAGAGSAGAGSAGGVRAAMELALGNLGHLSALHALGVFEGFPTAASNVPVPVSGSRVPGTADGAFRAAKAKAKAPRAAAAAASAAKALAVHAREKKISVGGVGGVGGAGRAASPSLASRPASSNPFGKSDVALTSVSIVEASRRAKRDVPEVMRAASL